MAVTAAMLSLLQIRQLSSLIDYRYKHHFKAERGTHGKRVVRHGSDGQGPCCSQALGTVVRELSDKHKSHSTEIADLLLLQAKAQLLLLVQWWPR